MSAAAGLLTPAQISQIRRWARRVAADGSDDELRAVARTIVRLADEAERLRAALGPASSWGWSDAPAAEGIPPTDVQLVRVRRWAERAVSNGVSAERNAAAKAVLLLCDDLASFRGDDREETAPAAAPGRRAGPPPAASLARTIRRWRRQSRLSWLGAAVPAAVLLAVFLGSRAAAPDLDPKGPAAGGVVGAAALEKLQFSIAGGESTLEEARWELDGKDVSGRAKLAAGRVVLRATDLADGDHAVAVRLPGLAPWAGGGASWSFTVDTVPPEIEVTKASLQAAVRSPYRLTGRAASATSLTVGGKPVRLENGRFAVAYAAPPAREVVLVAKDGAGNRTEARLSVALVPRRPTRPIRAVHVTAEAWANDELRAGVLALIDEGRINAVELDLKDESGAAGWNPPVALARQSGAARDMFDLEAAVKLLHGKGVRVIGRLVAFRDPVLAEWAWKGKRRSMVIQTPGGKAYSGGYGGFTNFADPAVRKYNVDIAVAAAKLGVDDILYDYVRRPDGPLETMVFPGFEGDPEEPIVTFLAETRERLEPHGTFLGTSVFGIAATRPHEIAQNIPLMAREVDYVSPMLYPSHWGPDEYGISNPNAQPYDIVFRALEDFQVAVEGTGARVVPWLQDFSLGIEYGPAEVRAQIEATSDAGLSEFLVWDPAVTYTAAALSKDAPLPTTGTAKPAAGSDELVPLRAAETGAVESGLEPNELGIVPVLMYHQILPDGGGEYDLTPEEFRDELERLYREHYRPITASDLVNGTIDVPKGTTPVVMTFDDSTASQAALLDDGEIDPATAVGIMLEFAREHPDFEPAGTFYPNHDPFGAEGNTAELLQWLAANGFELGNHTRDHANLGELAAGEVQQQLVLGNRLIREVLPGYEVVTMALPYGALPADPRLARKGSWDGEPYEFEGVMLVGAEPAPSPFGRSFDPAGIPRIRSFPTPELENGSADWLNRLAESPELRYVSDGDPKRVTFPEARAEELADRYRSQARAY